MFWFMDLVSECHKTLFKNYKFGKYFFKKLNISNFSVLIT